MDNSPSFVTIEEEQFSFWQKEKIFKKSLEQTSKGPRYIFYDGPPFANGLPHHGHLVGSILKDIVPRYQTMKGNFVERRFGWDCHGVPIEYEIDQKLQMHALDAIKKIGVKGYNDQCRKIVSRYTAQWEKTINRLGRWVDFANDYKTMDCSFMESVWWAFKELWNKNLVYKSNQVLPFSTALGSPLSNFEAGLNYKEIQDLAITALFQLKDENAFMAAWTTTPWTLPANLALCVSPDLEYSLVDDGEKKIYFATTALERYGEKSLKVVAKKNGREMVGKQYRPLFPFFEHLTSQGAFTVLADEFVTADAGSGVVHLAPGLGQDDARVISQAGLKKVFACPIDEVGRFTDEVTLWKGKFVLDSNKSIVHVLKERGVLFHQGQYLHSYPFCYRSDTPLIYRAIPSWFVAVSKIRDDLIKANREVNWIPQHLRDGRFGKWLENAKDWCISRNRIWGTPIPLWHNQTTGQYLCLGSLGELEKYTGEKVEDLHRDFIDDLSFSISGEKGEYCRISEVFDCWFESGAMPYAQLHYPFENKEIFAKGFPAQFIAEGLDQTRGWFYTLMVLSTALFNRPAFKNVVVNGIVLARDGKKMSKRLKNYTAPDIILEKHGADALRLYLINSPLIRGENMAFTDQGVVNTIKQVLLPWYNAYKFFVTYAKVDKWSAEKLVQGENPMDQWIKSRLQTLQGKVGEEMESYHLYRVVPILLVFIEELTNWYIRLNRSRFWGEDNSSDKMMAYSTLYHCSREFSLVMAPFAPFLSEYIYRGLKEFSSSKEEPLSVHLATYPTPDKKQIDEKLEKAMELVQQVIVMARKKRTEEKIKVKIPLAKMVCIHSSDELLEKIKKFEQYLQKEINVKGIEYRSDEENFIVLTARANLPRLGKRLGRQMGRFKKLIENLSPKEIGRVMAEGKIELEGESFTEEDILLSRQGRPNLGGVVASRTMAIELDCQLTEELIEEGLAREVVNRIQKSRKEMDLYVAQRIKLSYSTPSPSLAKAMSIHHDYIARETLATAITTMKEGEKGPFSFTIDGHRLAIKISV